MKPRILMFIIATVFSVALTSATWLSAQHTHYKLISLGGGGANATLSTTQLIFECRNLINAGCQCLNGRTVTLSNLGDKTLDITGITVTGAFSETNNCGTTLAAGKSCSISVGWSEKNSIGEIYVNDNAPHSPQKVSLSGYKFCTPI
jgi:hypothetical protein